MLIECPFGKLTPLMVVLRLHGLNSSPVVWSGPSFFQVPYNFHVGRTHCGSNLPGASPLLVKTQSVDPVYSLPGDLFLPPDPGFLSKVADSMRLTMIQLMKELMVLQLSIDRSNFWFPDLIQTFISGSMVSCSFWSIAFRCSFKYFLHSEFIVTCYDYLKYRFNV